MISSKPFLWPNHLTLVLVILGASSCIRRFVRTCKRKNTKLKIYNSLSFSDYSKFTLCDSFDVNLYVHSRLQEALKPFLDGWTLNIPLPRGFWSGNNFFWYVDALAVHKTNRFVGASRVIYWHSYRHLLTRLSGKIRQVTVIEDSGVFSKKLSRWVSRARTPPKRDGFETGMWSKNPVAPATTGTVSSGNRKNHAPTFYATDSIRVKYICV